jgi:hypothetical protein
MLSSSPFKIHEPLVTGVSPRPPTDDSTRNCETRDTLWVPRTLTLPPTSAITVSRRTSRSP